MTTPTKPQKKSFIKKALTICLSQPKIAQKPQLIFLCATEDNENVIGVSAVFQSKSFLNGSDNTELKFAVKGIQLHIENYGSSKYEISKICRVIGSQELIVEIKPTQSKPKPVNYDFEPIIYKIGDRFKFEILKDNQTEPEKICQNIYVV